MEKSMKSEIKKLPRSRVRIHIHLTNDEVDSHREHVLDGYAATVKLPGFRQGKAPSALIESHIGTDAIDAEVRNHSITDAYFEAVKEHNIHPLQGPSVSEVNHQNGLSFVAEVDCLPEVKIKDWKGIRVKQAFRREISTADTEKVLTHLQKERAKLLDVDRPLKSGDFASISYTGKLGGVIQENMTSKHHPLVIGEGTLIPGFEDELIGMKSGDEKTFPINFPKDYVDKAVAGKKAEFTVTLDSMKELELPELDETFAKDFGKDSVNDLKSAIKEQLEQEAETESKARSQDDVLSKLVEHTTADLPQIVIDEEIDRLIKSMQERLKLNDEQFDIYLEKQNKDRTQLRKEAEGQATKNAFVGLALGSIMEELNIDPSEKNSAKKVIDLLVEEASK